MIDPALSDTRLQIWQESRTAGMVPINVNTQQARERVWNGQDYTFTDNLASSAGGCVAILAGIPLFYYFARRRAAAQK